MAAAVGAADAPPGARPPYRLETEYGFGPGDMTAFLMFR